MLLVLSESDAIMEEEFLLYGAHEKDMNRASQSPFSHVIRKAASVNAHCKQNTVLPGLFQHVDFVQDCQNLNS